MGWTEPKHFSYSFPCDGPGINVLTHWSFDLSLG